MSASAACSTEFPRLRLIHSTAAAATCSESRGDRTRPRSGTTGDPSVDYAQLFDWGSVVAEVDDDEFDVDEWQRGMRSRGRADGIEVSTHALKCELGGWLLCAVGGSNFEPSPSCSPTRTRVIWGGPDAA